MASPWACPTLTHLLAAPSTAGGLPANTALLGHGDAQAFRGHLACSSWAPSFCSTAKFQGASVLDRWHLDLSLCTF